jgi:hypothetical protein
MSQCATSCPTSMMTTGTRYAFDSTRCVPVSHLVPVHSRTHMKNLVQPIYTRDVVGHTGTLERRPCSQLLSGEPETGTNWDRLGLRSADHESVLGENI